MKKLLMFLLLGLSFGCKKDNGLTVKQVTTFLTNNATKTWRLKSIAVNGQNQTLTTAQSAFTKTYNKDGSWTDSDGYKGTFSVLTITSLSEVTTNSMPASTTVQYDILTVSNTSLIIEYTYNQVKYKFEFSA